MALTYKQIKQRYFDKVYANASMIECACGCGTKIKSKDHYGRNRIFANGHNGRKYKDPTEYKRAWNHRNRKARYEYKQRWIKAFKAELIGAKGGKCQLCGIPFNGECSAMFEFHHRDPLEKKFDINAAMMNRVSKAKIWAEAGKCDLLCANCHRLVHWYEGMKEGEI